MAGPVRSARGRDPASGARRHAARRRIAAALIAAAYRVQSNPAFPFRRRANDLPAIVEAPESTSQQEIQMHKLTHRALLAGIVAGSFGIASTAFAGACPADQIKTDVRAVVTTPAKGVTDTTLAAVDLAK